MARMYQKPMDLKGKLAVVTGSSSAIGTATVKALNAIGMKIVKVDLTTNTEYLEFFAWLAKKVGPIHVLVNNAGRIGLNPSSSISHGNPDDWNKIIEANFNNILISCKEAIKNMQTNDIDGYIINISSISGIKPLPFPKTSVYSSTKFCLRGMTENLKMELARANSRIRTTCLHHGMVTDEVFEVSGLSKEVTQDVVFKNNPYLSSEDVANVIRFLVETPQHVQVSVLTIQATGGDL